jgi:hypothetical protein
MYKEYLQICVILFHFDIMRNYGLILNVLHFKTLY